MLYFIIVEPPPSFFRGPSIFAVFQVMVVVFWALLQKNKNYLNKIILKKYFQREEYTKHTTKQTFTHELESIERMLRQIELSLIAGDHESYKTSASSRSSSCYQRL